jgi:hypothetical protein
MKTVSSFLCCLLAVCVSPLALAQGHGGGGPDTATPVQLVQTYEALADTMLAAKKAEWSLVHSILAMTFRHAQGTMAAAKAKIQAGQDAGVEIEKLATLVAQLGNEGDATVGAVRKRLVDGGHHHHAADEKEGLYDEGFVIVTRPAKKVFLGAATNIGKLARAADLGALEAEWETVQKQFGELHKGVRD